MKVLVIGGGPAGMMAAYTAANNGHQVLLLEQNEKLGKKLFITGKGRCNLTNAGDRDSFFQNVPRNGRFLYSAYQGCTPQDVMDLIQGAGTPLKVERGNRVFPVSDKSSDIIRAWEKLLHRAGVTVQLNTAVESLLIKEGRVEGVAAGGKQILADAVVVATGGQSYASTGSTGDGYRFAKQAGHTLQEIRPSLVPLETVENWPFPLTGISLKNVTLTVKKKGKKVFSELGEMLFTHFGVSGPLVLSASALIADDPAGAELYIDFKPALDEATLDARLVRDLSENAKKQVGAALHALLPARLLSTVLALSGIDPALAVGELTKKQRQGLVAVLKGARLTVKGARPLNEAIVTRGGVQVKEIQSSTMESKLVQGLYFAGEVLDIDAFTGGFNLQVAWSTGAAAGRSI